MTALIGFLIDGPNVHFGIGKNQMQNYIWNNGKIALLIMNFYYSTELVKLGFIIPSVFGMVTRVIMRCW